MSLVFDVEGNAQATANPGHHSRQSHEAPQAWDSLDTGTPSRNGRNRRNAITQSPDAAMASLQRSPNRISFSTIDLPLNGDAIEIVSRSKGRHGVMLAVPEIQGAIGVLISNSPDGIQQGGAAPPAGVIVLPTGIPFLFIPTEAALWGATTIANTAAQIQVIELHYAPDND